VPYDLTKTHYSLSLQKDVAAGQVVDREGVVLRSVLEGGVEKVQKADAASAAYAICGFAVSDNEVIGIMPFVEDLVIPAAPGPYQVQLSHTSLVGTAPNSSVRVMLLGTSTDLTEVAGAPAAGQFQPNVATGLLTFEVTQAGLAIRVWYRANLTVAESRQRYFQRSVNNDAGALFNTVVVGGGTGEILTAEYDTNVDWANVAAGAITTGADGILTTGGTGTVIPGGKVIHVPDVDNAMLGIAFNLPG
jgi:hypothetical protein